MCLFFCVCIQKVGQPRVCKVGKSLFSNLILTCFTYFLCASKMFKHIDDLLLVTHRDLSGKTSKKENFLKFYSLNPFFQPKCELVRGIPSILDT